MRLKVLVSRFYYIFAVALVVAAGVGAFFVYENFQTDYRTVTAREPVYSYRASYGHSAVIQEENPIWPVGRLLSNRKAYFSSISPILRSTFSFKMSNIGTGSGVIHLDTYLEVTSEGSDFVFWEKTYEKAEVTENFSSSTVSTVTQVHTENLNERIDNIQDNIGFSGGSVSIKLVTEVGVQGRADNETVNISEVYEMPLEIGGPTYSTGSDLSWQETVTRTYEEEVEDESPMQTKALSLLLLLAPLAAFGFLTSEWKELDEEEINRVQASQEKDQYDEWISEGEMPELDARAKVKIGSLEDLVDLAVDLNRRVIYDGDKSIYYVFHDDLLYVYTGLS